MPKRSGQKPDFMQVARTIVERAIGEQMDGSPLEEPEHKSSRAQAGSIGGKKGGRARAKSLSPSKRKEIAQKAAQARWIKRKQRGTR